MKTLTTILCMLMKKNIRFYPNLSFRASIISLSITIMLAMHSILIPAYGQWFMHTIDPNIEYSTSIVAFDIDNDEDMDLFVAEDQANNLLFYENNNNLPWAKQVIDNLANRAVGLDLADFDGDGKMDLIAGCYGANLVSLYKNTGGDPNQWIKDTIDNLIAGPTEVWAKDIDGDGAQDVVVDFNITGEICWYENNLPTGWTSHLIGSGVEGAGGSYVADINNDDKPDVLKPVTKQDKILIYINNLPDSNWTEIVLDDNMPGAFWAAVADIDKDGDIDIAATSQEAKENEPDVAWYENDGSGQVWTKHPICDDLVTIRSLNLVDIDANGYVDIIVGDTDADDLILLMNNDGGQNWTKSIVDDNFEDPNVIVAYDIDSDNDTDIIPSRMATGPLVWYENPGPVILEDYSFNLLSDTVFNPGDSLEIELMLKNNGSTVTVTNIKAGLISLDTLVTVPGYSRSFKDIAAGESSTSDSTYLIIISEQCTNITQVPIVVNITGDDNTFWADTFSITVQPPASIKNFREPIARIYPNPTNNILYIEISNAGNQGLEIEILDITGKVIYQKKYNNVNAQFVEQLDLSDYTKGIYLVKVRQADTVYVGKVVVR